VIPILYRSTDASAPVLSGTVGALVALLDACLVNGYGAKSPLGWTKDFSGTNRAVYRAPAGVRHYLDINDNAPGGTAGAREAIGLGYETMTGVGAGTLPWPAGNIWWRKSLTADATARPWVVIGDDRTFYLLVASEAAGTYYGYGFGEFLSLVVGDPTRSFVCGHITENTGTAAQETLDRLSSGLALTIIGGFYAPHMFHGKGPAVALGHIGDGAKSNPGSTADTGLNGFLAFPNPPDGGLYIAPVALYDQSPQREIRGYVRGLYHQCHGITNFVDGDTFGGDSTSEVLPCNPYEDKAFVMVKQGPNAGIFTFETTEWTAN
jgi:hypothetical protein